SFTPADYSTLRLSKEYRQIPVALQLGFKISENLNNSNETFITFGFTNMYQKTLSNFVDAPEFTNEYSSLLQYMTPELIDINQGLYNVVELDKLLNGNYETFVNDPTKSFSEKYEFYINDNTKKEDLPEPEDWDNGFVADGVGTVKSNYSTFEDSKFNRGKRSPVYRSFSTGFYVSKRRWGFMFNLETNIISKKNRTFYNFIGTSFGIEYALFAK
ncbi:MAG: hypothetical protein ACK5ZT_01040, partial [Sphingobacteriaceae bacterium]